MDISKDSKTSASASSSGAAASAPTPTGPALRCEVAVIARVARNVEGLDLSLFDQGTTSPLTPSTSICLCFLELLLTLHSC
jgi:hypothetical protein